MLAGEARKPGTFSKGFIRFIDEVDREVLAAFQRLLPFIFQDKIPKSEGWQAGERFNDGLLLEEAGIIVGTSSFLNSNFTISSAGNQMLFDGPTALVFIGEPNTEISAPSWIITSLGRRLFDLMKTNAPFVSHVHFAECTPKDGLTEIWSGPWADAGNGQRRAHKLIIHWTKPDK